MTRLFLAAALMAAVPTFVHAQTAPMGYVEGAIGISLIDDVETKDYIVDVPGFGTFAGHAEADYNTEFTGGAEIGLTTGRWRFGASWDFTSAQLDKARVRGDARRLTLQRRDHRRSARGRFRDLARQQRARLRGQRLLQFRAARRKLQALYRRRSRCCHVREGVDRVRGDRHLGRAIYARAALLCRRALSPDAYRRARGRCRRRVRPDHLPHVLAALGTVFRRLDVPQHERRDKGDDHDQSDQIDDAVHCVLSG